MITTCSTRGKLCGRIECDICYTRSIASYLRENKLEHCWLEATDPFLILKSSCGRYTFLCKKCNQQYTVGLQSFITSSGCRGCSSSSMKSNTKEFILKAKNIHGDRYDYSKVDYIGNKDKVIIICSEHGEFHQKPNGHLLGWGCIRCGHNTSTNATRSNTEEFTLKARSIHGDRYDYSKVDYINSLTKITIICTTHSEFTQLPGDHLFGHGCKRCGYETNASAARSNTEEFILKAKRVHGDRYDYSKVDYMTSNTNVTIMCSRGHEFEQVPGNHLSGQGCPRCKYKTELKIYEWLKKIYPNLDIQHNKSIPSLLSNRRYDIYLLEYNLIIEIDGIQHFETQKCFKVSHSTNQRLDILKMIHANKAGISVIRISQGDIWNDVSINGGSWQDILLKHIQSYDIPTNIYLSSKTSLYNNHISLMKRGVTIDQWKQNKNSNNKTRYLHKILSWLAQYEKDNIFTIPRGNSLNITDANMCKSYKLSNASNQTYPGIRGFFSDIIGCDVKIDISDNIITIKINIKDSLLHMLTQ